MELHGMVLVEPSTFFSATMQVLMPSTRLLIVIAVTVLFDVTISQKYFAVFPVTVSDSNNHCRVFPIVVITNLWLNE